MKKKVMFKPTSDYEKIHEASIEAINLMDGPFTRTQLKDAINDLLAEDKLIITRKLLDTRVSEQVDIGALTLITKGVGRRPYKYKRVRDVERIARKYVFASADPDLPNTNTATPKQVANFLLDYINNVIGVSESINYLSTLRKDAATMHELQDRCSQLVERHNADQREITRLKTKVSGMSAAVKQYEIIAKEHDRLAAKLKSAMSALR